MLKALELVGFKSFADKTRFEFPPGITAVVGPNGSGKSNVVDAIKWVLGEQSVKSLRGKEMADVIFNGSGARRAMNAAEVTLTFDNSRALLAVDTPEVHITRRVYRSGEGEYLINRQPTRLRDIRDLLAGTGMGTQAYSVIEQGKVDVLLQSSAKDRRVIFEEAAGISRFKARKIEALRRLERVEQNLLRLSDIVDEVESRLRSVKLQANKARRYKEYVDRLQELRTQVALVDWTRLSELLSGFEADVAELTRQRDGTIAEAEAIEARLLEAEARVGELTEAIRASEAQTAADRERIAAAESTIEHSRARSSDLEQEVARLQRQLASLSVRAGGLEQHLRETRAAVEAAEGQQRQVARQLGERERAMTDVIARLDQLRAESHQRRAGQVEQMRAATALSNQISALESQADAALVARDRCRSRLGDLDQQLSAVDQQCRELRDQREQLAGQAGQLSDRVAAVQTRLEQLRAERDQKQGELADLHKRLSAMAERVAVLEELERRYEGLSPGVKEVLAQAKSGQDGPFRQVCGLVADLFRVSVESASLVEVALGETAQHIVVRPGRELLDHLQAQPKPFSGRVGFLWLGAAAEPDDVDNVNFDGWPGVLGRADRFVETEPEYEPLARRLLGRTWFVEKLSHALTLAQTPQRTCHFVTLAGDLLTADGTLCVGPRHASTGLISRRSELRALHAQLTGLETQVQQAEAAIVRVQQQIAHDQSELGRAQADHRQAGETLARHDQKLVAAEERKSHLAQQRTVLEAELRAAEGQYEVVGGTLAETRLKLRSLEAGLADTEREMARLAEELERWEADRTGHGREATEAKIELAKGEERLGSLRARLRQFEESQQERHRAAAESNEQLADCLRRADESQWSILRAESETAELYLRKESSAGRTAGLVQQREAVQADRVQLGANAQRIRAKVRKLEEKVHAKELAANEVRLERNALVDRFREDYGVTLTELEHEPTEEEQHQREEAQKEIEELRQKINNLGNVNLEALEELDQLETRHSTLAAQHKDLSDAKGSLQRIIERINADSRRLFAETLETVRGHFVSLFRDLFGGGQADIVLEENVDMLESGIEIVARPPGKEPRSISLLSGGEKTLTCVALLLAIFRSRPSPFCVLDEVDAALDEANIDRFTKVLRDFLAWTQFIIVTHSKKTMTCATTIYGVTMQESGISKQVSVRFEDVSDNGEILLSAPSAEETQAA
jgi:chromosome segregation protein